MQLYQQHYVDTVPPTHYFIKNEFLAQAFIPEFCDFAKPVTL